MSAGRNPSWNPVAELDASVWSEVVALTSKGRLTLPIALRRRLPWGEPLGSVVALVVLSDHGAAELLPWVPGGEEVLRLLSKAVSALPTAGRSEIVLAAMDRYLRITFEPDGRATLPTNLLVHLDAHRTGIARVVARDGRLWLWSETSWRDGRAERFAKLQAVTAPHRSP
jgi:hypothetical protein